MPSAEAPGPGRFPLYWPGATKRVAPEKKFGNLLPLVTAGKRTVIANLPGPDAHLHAVRGHLLPVTARLRKVTARLHSIPPDVPRVPPSLPVVRRALRPGTLLLRRVRTELRSVFAAVHPWQAHGTCHTAEEEGASGRNCSLIGKARAERSLRVEATPDLWVRLPPVPSRNNAAKSLIQIQSEAEGSFDLHHDARWQCSQSSLESRRGKGGDALDVGYPFGAKKWQLRDFNLIRATPILRSQRYTDDEHAGRLLIVAGNDNNRAGFGS